MRLRFFRETREKGLPKIVPDEAFCADDSARIFTVF